MHHSLYTPKMYASNEKTRCLQLMNENSFALLLTWNGPDMFTSHVPFIVESSNDERVVLKFHLARKNPHCQALMELQKKEQPGWNAMVVFTGPHFYISPKWFASKEGQEKAVPTWNFSAVHALCEKCRVVSDVTQKFNMLQELSDVNEKVLLQSMKHPDEALDNYLYDFSKTNAKYQDVMMKELVAFELDVKELKGKWKMSQEKPGTVSSIAEGLRRQGSELAVSTANMMQDLNQ